jgi:hypothetical protein
VGIGESGATSGKSAEIRRLGLWMPAERFYPVVEVIHSNKKHVGRLLFRLSRGIAGKSRSDMKPDYASCQQGLE